MLCQQTPLPNVQVNQLRFIRFVLVVGGDDLLVLLFVVHAQRVLRYLFFHDLAYVFTGRGLALE